VFWHRFSFRDTQLRPMTLDLPVQREQRLLPKTLGPGRTWM
jgi:hypothetical protein